MAISWARRIFRIVSGHHEPAFTVGSFATTTPSRPCTMPRPVTTPAAGAWPSYWSYATRRPISTNGAPSSQSLVTRSRADSFPCAWSLATFAEPPPWRRRSSSARTSALSSRSRVVTAESGFLAGALGEPGADVVHQLAGRRARPEQLANPHRLERLHVLARDDPAPGDE